MTVKGAPAFAYMLTSTDALCVRCQDAHFPCAACHHISCFLSSARLHYQLHTLISTDVLLCAAKVRDGAQFFTRGVRLLGSDISSAGRLFYRAGAGASLKPREVCTDCV